MAKLTKAKATNFLPYSFTAMMKATLQFPSLPDLISFQAKASKASFRITISDLTLTGTFSEEEIHMARQEYQASLLSAEPIFN